MLGKHKLKKGDRINPMAVYEKPELSGLAK